MGLMAMGTKDTNVLNVLKEVLFKDKAISGEGAATAIGMLMMGTNDADLIEELVN